MFSLIKLQTNSEIDNYPPHYIINFYYNYYKVFIMNRYNGWDNFKLFELKMLNKS